MSSAHGCHAASRQALPRRFTAHKLTSTSRRRVSFVPASTDQHTHVSAVTSVVSDDAGSTLFPEQDVKAIALTLDPQSLKAVQEAGIVSDVVAEPTSVTSESLSPVARFWAAYCQALTTHPIPTKSATSFCGFLIGDALSQLIVGDTYSAWRTFRMVLFGVFMDGPVGHVWYTTLDRNVEPNDPTSNKAVILKTCLDQFIWAPFFTCVFYFFQNTLQGHWDHTMVDIQIKLLPTLAANYVIWPAAHLINFRYIPSQQRILYINCVQILWSAFLSHMAASGAGLSVIHH